MYHTCLFCNADLGANAVIEAFPVGRRLAFDGEKGRLWVVCRRCERWNLTPMEERWEAIEACERAFRGTTLRVSTDNIGLARVKEGLELVRIGRALRPEMAAWRYGDQFGRRQRKFLALGAVGVAAGAAVVAFGPWSALLSLSAGGVLNVANGVRGAKRAWNRQVVSKLRLANGERMELTRAQVENAQLRSDREHGWALRIEVPKSREVKLFGRTVGRRDERSELPWDDEVEDVKGLRITGGDALRVASAILPRINKGGAGRHAVQEGVALLEAAKAPEHLLSQVARSAMRESRIALVSNRSAGAIAGLPHPQRLALEMAVNEDVERRALEGELRLLEAAWRDAEEVAKIADDLFLPAGIDERLEALRRPR